MNFKWSTENFSCCRCLVLWHFVHRIHIYTLGWESVHLESASCRKRSCIDPTWAPHRSSERADPFSKVLVQGSETTLNWKSLAVQWLLKHLIQLNIPGPPKVLNRKCGSGPTAFVHQRPLGSGLISPCATVLCIRNKQRKSSHALHGLKPQVVSPHH